MNHSPLETATILVVDDLPENARILESFLRPMGFSVYSVENGEAALAFVQKTPPDIILLDLMMPGITGFEVCERLKRDPATHHIPIIVVTGVSDKESNVKAIRAGADDYLTKPFDSVLLAARIHTSLKSKLLQDQVLAYQRELEDRVRERTCQIIKTQQVTVFALAKLAESRDNETGKHLERMRLYARELAEEMATRDRLKRRITPEFIEALFESSPLHDIGKVGIPDRILLKPGKLTELEFEAMKRHAAIGGDTLRSASAEAGNNAFLAMGQEIAFHHHEKWDGSGYPSGLSGETIPLPARIVALADVYDALSSRRPYKEPFPHEKAKAIIAEGRGKHFDTEVHDAFLAREDAFLRIREKYGDDGSPTPIQVTVDALERAGVSELNAG